jgi:hypothetical protein
VDVERAQAKRTVYQQVQKHLSIPWSSYCQSQIPALETGLVMSFYREGKRLIEVK